MQLLFTPPLVILFLFLIINLIVGSCFTKQATTFSAYAIGYKQFATPTLVATMLATQVAGSDIRVLVIEAHKVGFSSSLLFHDFLNSLYLAIVVTCMGPFIQQHLSIAETLGSAYGKKARVVAALCYLGLAISCMAREIYTIYWAIDRCLGGLLDRTDLQWLIVVVGLVFIMYTSGGGARAVVWTDVLQLMIFTIIIPFFILHTLMQTGKSGSEVLMLLSAKVQWKNPMCLSLETIMEIFSFCPLVLPQDIQRGYMAVSPVQAGKSFVYASFFLLLIMGCMQLVGVLASVALPLSTDVWLDLFSPMSAPVKGVILCSILTLSMSTADSILHISAVLVSHDILPHVKGIQTIVVKRPVYVARVVSLVIGITILAIVLLKPSSVIRWSSYILSFAYVTMIMPTALVFLGFQRNNRAILIGMFTGLIVMVLGWKIWGGFSICAIRRYALLVNVFVFFVARYLLPQRSSGSNKLS